MKDEKLLVDSDVFFALIDKNDTNHNKALHINEELISRKQLFFTLNVVIFETITVLSHKISQIAAISFLDSFQAGKMEIMRIDEKTEESAFEIFRLQSRKNTSFVDCANMAVMRQLKIDTVFSFDKIYKTNGFKRAGIDQ